MDDGYVRQFGQTSHIYRNPITLSASQIFSDPPINHAKVIKRGTQMHLDQFQWELPSKFQSLADGDYQIAIRPHHILPYQDHSAIIPMSGRVGVTELSGSESSAHFEFGSNNWVSLAHGVHPYNRGEEHTFYVNPEECLFFTLDGERAA